MRATTQGLSLNVQKFCNLIFLHMNRCQKVFVDKQKSLWRTLAKTFRTQFVEHQITALLINKKSRQMFR